MSIINDDFKILDWDSNYFGFRVATIVNEKHTIDSITLILRKLKSDNIKLVYWPSDSEDKNSQYAALKCNGFLADKKTTYSRRLDNYDISIFDIGNRVVEYKAKTPTDELINLGILSGEYSRFKIDKNFSRSQFEGLYKLWIINSINKKVADTIYVSYSMNKITSMITLQKKGGIGIIGLIAVDKVMQGKKIGITLVNQAIQWSKEQGCEIAKVVTQYDNKPACSLYEKCGYSIEKIENFYHFWL